MQSSHRTIYTVDHLSSEIKKLLEMSYADVWVEGEVSSVATPASGHCYFTLKEDSTVLKCVLFKNKKYLATTLPTVGERILIRGRVSTYSARGDIQLICAYIEAAGEGELRRQYDELKNRLKADGLFDEKNKQPIPAICKDIALITSLQGAVLHDIITTLNRRFPFVTLKVYPTSVQGEKAKKQVLAALSNAVSNQPEVIIIARGGGSLEDLHAFNDEDIARAVYASNIPVISAIGHETDFTICDFVADLRAPTPTAAATLIAPDIKEIKSLIRQSVSSISKMAYHILNTKQQSLDIASQKIKHPLDGLKIQNSELKHWLLRLTAVHQSSLRKNQQHLSQLKLALQYRAPHMRLMNNTHALDSLEDQLASLMKNTLSSKRDSLRQLTSQLGAYNPTTTLARGYAILLSKNGVVVSSSKHLKPGDTVTARLNKGGFESTVDSVEN